MSIQVGDDMKLTADQENAFNAFLSGKNLFITGPGGTGKTSLIRYFIKSRKKHWNIGFTSTTGISAILIGGCTIHSFLGIGLATGTTDELLKRIRQRPAINKRWRSLRCLIIDEVSMLHPDLFEKIDILARCIRQRKEPFGGIQLILTGDFLQIYPVKSKKFCFQTDSWKSCNFQVFYLRENIRQEHDKEFQECLNRMRLGQVDDFVMRLLSIRQNASYKDLEIKPTHLFSLKHQTRQYNAKKFQKLIRSLPSTDCVRLYTSVVDVQDERVGGRLESIIKDLRVPHKLELAKGAQVILLANIDTADGLANGSRGIVTRFDKIHGHPVVKFLNGVEVVIEPFPFEIEENGSTTVVVTQIPLSLAYALTIHSSQGCTIDHAVIDLSNVFEYGQAYVACSRVRCLENLYFRGDIDFSRIMAHPDAVKFYEELNII